MAKKGGSTQVQQVDPVALANAQTASNRQTAELQQRLNMINSYGPTGSVEYRSDPNAPGGYSQTTSLSPEEQQSYNLSKQAENAAYGLANDQIGRVGQALAGGFNGAGLPGLSSGSNITRGGIQMDVGPSDFSADRQKVEDALYARASSRLDPMWSQSENKLKTDLANQGLGINSTAYGTATGNFARDKNDAYASAINDSILAGGQEQSRLFSDQLSQADFRNRAQQQDFGQQFNIAGLNNQARSQGFQERAYEQNLPINQFTALMGAGQVNMPNGIQYTPTSVAPTDTSVGYDINQRAQAANAQANAQRQSALMGGLFKLGSAFISDRRLKTNVVRLGRRRDGLGVYAYQYVWGGPAQIGVMAQEVAGVRPEAVITMPSGYMAVDYGAL